MPLQCRLTQVLGLVFAALLATPVAAAVLHVDTTVDDASAGACDDGAAADCSLRGAVIKANGLAEASTIVVPAGTYILSQPTVCPYRDGFGNPEAFSGTALCIDADVTLVGAGADETIIDGNHLDRVVLVNSGRTVGLQRVTLRNGSDHVGDHVTFIPIAGGGGIYNAGILILADAMVTANTALGGAAGVENWGTLVLSRSVVTANASGGGPGGPGGIESHGRLDVFDSTISSNVAVGSVGGGIDISGGTATISGSTINDNESPNGGGGIYVASTELYPLIVTNSTISGNRSGGNGGAGILGGFDLYVVLNNVTITGNTGAQTGGIDGIFVAGNSLIAGNASRRPVYGAPDCSGYLQSTGYNLIGDRTSCKLQGDQTGNIVGKDPLLGDLDDHGGRTRTHALDAGSPAIDAGSPALPGSGGAACAVADQRGILRPIGARCDIGAFERTSSLAETNADVFPSTGGNAGPVSVEVRGGGFDDGANVRLSRSGQPTIPGTRVQVDLAGGVIAATFDLTGAAIGPWNVVITNADATSRTLPAAFTIEAGGAADLWVDVVGSLRRHAPSTFTIIYGNRANVDALAVPLSISMPAGAGYQAFRHFEITPPPTPPGEPRPDWSAAKEVVAQPGETNRLQLPLLLPIIPSGYVGTLRIVLTLPPDFPDNVLVAAVGSPKFTSVPDAAFVASAVSGAQAYLQQVAGMTIPPASIPAVQQYVTWQMQQVVADGQGALAATLGARSQVYSLAQLQLGLVRFAVLQVLDATAVTPSRAVTR